MIRSTPLTPIGRALCPQSAAPLAALAALAVTICLRLPAAAAQIISPSVGDIYTLPDWLPRSVDAAHTPGNHTNAAQRITGDTYAALAAASEAYIERAWFMTGDRHDHGYTGAFPDGVKYVVDYPDAITNFVWNPSRRFVHFGDYDLMRRAMMHYLEWGYGYGVYYGIFEPNFDRLSNHRPALLASSLFGGGPAFPQFDWTPEADVILTADTWPIKAHFDCLTLDPYLVATYFSADATNRTLAAEFLQNYIPALKTNDLPVVRLGTLPDILARHLPPADYGMITNQSQRLLWPRMAACNQALAALDRSYCFYGGWDSDYIVDDNYSAWTTYTNNYHRVAEHYTNTYYIGSVSISEDGELVGWNSLSRGLAGDWQLADYTVTETNRWSGVTGHEVASVSRTTTGAQCGALDIDLAAVMFTTNDMQQIYNTLPAKSDSNCDLYDITRIAWRRESDRIETTYSATVYYHPVSSSYPDNTSVVFTVTSFIERNPSCMVSYDIDCDYYYLLSHPQSTVTNAPAVPSASALASGRVRELEICALDTLYHVTNTTWEVSDDGMYDWWLGGYYLPTVGRDDPIAPQNDTFKGCPISREWRALRTTLTGNFASGARSFARSDLSGLATEARTRLIDFVGANPALTEAYTAPQRTFARSETPSRLAIAPALEYVSLLPYHDIYANVSNGVVFGISSGSRLSPNPVQMGSYMADINLTLSSSVTNAVPERPACTYQGSSSQGYRIDWNWHTLRLLQ